MLYILCNCSLWSACINAYVTDTHILGLAYNLCQPNPKVDQQASLSARTTRVRASVCLDSNNKSMWRRVRAYTTNNNSNYNNKRHLVLGLKNRANILSVVCTRRNCHYTFLCFMLANFYQKSRFRNQTITATTTNTEKNCIKNRCKNQIKTSMKWNFAKIVLVLHVSLFLRLFHYFRLICRY